MTTPTTKHQNDTVILAPSFRLPIALVAIAIALYWISLWISIPVGLFAIFLGIQTAILRLHFTTVAFELYRGKTQLRRFPYDQWINWEIFFGAIPILFYFKETQSIHFLPILFNPEQLKSALTQRCPKTNLPAAQQ